MLLAPLLSDAPVVSTSKLENTIVVARTFFGQGIEGKLTKKGRMRSRGLKSSSVD